MLGLISTTDGSGNTSYYLPDGLGSTSQLTNSAGTITGRYAYDAFGAIRVQSGATANDWRFTGQQQDYNANRGLYDLRARFYDAALGRFLTRDPLPFVQRYAYAGDNPVNLVDPSGLCGWTISLSNAKDCAKKGATKTAHAVESSVSAVGRAAEYCASSSHILECYEREEVASVGVAVVAFGVVVVGGGCGVVAPIVGGATAGIGFVPACGLSIFAGTVVVVGGGTLTYEAFQPWHERADTSVSTGSGTVTSRPKEGGMTLSRAGLQ